ncbi:MAG: hypothetical protein ACRDWV_07405 [Acidimicrobiales bacterium]
MKRLLIAASVPIVSICLLVGGASAAWAGSLGTYNGQGVNIRTGPSTGYPSLGEGSFGQYACTYSAVVGQDINGDPYWDYNRNESTNVDGYSADAYMYPYYYSQGC